MTAAEQLFWGEVSSKGATRRSLAVCYALLIAYAAGRLKAEDPVGGDFWTPINKALSERLNLNTHGKTDSFRRMAWSISDAAVTAREQAEAA